jgi:hypothetical protein
VADVASDVGEVKTAVGAQRGHDSSAAAVAGEALGIEAGDLRSSADFLS